MQNRGLWVASSLPGFMDVPCLWAGASSPRHLSQYLLVHPFIGGPLEVRAVGSSEEDQKDCSVLLKTLLPPLLCPGIGLQPLSSGDRP